MDLLLASGYELLHAETAEEGISAAINHMPSIILMDIALPGMDGLEATRRLKRDPRVQDIPVVAVSAHAMKGDDMSAMSAGCIGYITKPIDTRDFVRALEGYLGESQDLQSA